VESQANISSKSSTLQPLPFVSRLWFAWVCFFRVLFDGALAAGVKAAFFADTEAARADLASAAVVTSPTTPSEAPSYAALQLLALFQRQGRLVDFLKQDLAQFSDGEVGAVARVVHDGCRRALERHVHIDPIRAEPEGGPLELPRGFDAAEVKLTGMVQGEPPYRGVLRHRGWRATDLELPVAVDGHNPSILAPAEVEL
jgi:hypothetical protein